MTTGRVRVNLDSPADLREQLGLTASEVETIIRFRAEHGPIEDGRHLQSLLGGRPLPETELDFTPSMPTAPEAPGA